MKYCKTCAHRSGNVCQALSFLGEGGPWVWFDEADIEGCCDEVYMKVTYDFGCVLHEEKSS